MNACARCNDTGTVEETVPTRQPGMTLIVPVTCPACRPPPSRIALELRDGYFAEREDGPGGDCTTYVRLDIVEKLRVSLAEIACLCGPTTAGRARKLARETIAELDRSDVTRGGTL